MGKPEVTAVRPPPYADIKALAPNLIGEILAGELVVSPRPAPRHARTSFNPGVLPGATSGLGGGDPGGWCILAEPELYLRADVVVPDLAGWRLERMPVLPETAFFPLAPDWICEVLSDLTRRRDRVVKLSLSARERVAHVWLVDPIARTLEVFRLEGGGWMLVGSGANSDKVRAEPFDAVELELGLLWS